MADAVQISIPFDGKTETIRIPGGRLEGIVRSAPCAQSLNQNSIETAIHNPVDGFTFGNFLKDCQNLLIIVNDATRPTPTATVLDRLFPKIQHVDFKILVATGTHIPPSEFELKFIFGKHLNAFRGVLHIHDCYEDDSLHFYGTTPSGTEVRFNAILEKASHILVIGSVEPHYFAGFTGGRKAFLPGIAGYRSIEQNHSHAMSDAPKPMRLEGNPVHEDMMHALSFIRNKPIYSIQTVLSENNQILTVYSGEIEETFQAATEACRLYHGVPVQRKADIVIAVVRPPLDQNLYQSQKAMEHARLVLNSGGILILVSACRAGVGPDAFFKLLSSCSDLQKTLTSLQNHYRLGYHKAARWISCIHHASLFGVTRLSYEVTTPLHITAFKTVQAAVDAAFDRCDGSVLVIPDAAVTVPYLA